MPSGKRPQSSPHTSKKMTDDIQQRELLPAEENLAHLNYAMSISTLTWFCGNHEAAAKVLEEKVSTILLANPWLAGKLKNKGCGKVVLVHPRAIQPGVESRSHCNDHFSHQQPQSSPLKRTTPFDELQNSCKGYLATSWDCLWKVTVIPCRESPAEKFAVVHSMSHAIGDGHTYYRIHDMLCRNDETIEGLNADRLFETTALQMEGLLGDKDRRPSLCGKLSFVMAACCGLLRTTVLSPLGLVPKMQRRFFLVNHDQIASEKAAFTSGVSDRNNEALVEDQPPAFISTNDILTSWFFRKSKCAFGLMAINFRNRLPGHTADLCGNYENLSLYYPEDYASPLLIRKSIRGGKHGWRRAVTFETSPLKPSFCTHLGGRFAMVTNWSSFSREAHLEDCEEEFHIPLVAKFTAPANLAFCIIFRIGPTDQKAILVIADSAVMENLQSGSSNVINSNPIA